MSGNKSTLMQDTKKYLSSHFLSSYIIFSLIYQSAISLVVIFFDKEVYLLAIIPVVVVAYVWGKWWSFASGMSLMLLQIILFGVFHLNAINILAGEEVMEAIIVSVVGYIVGSLDQVRRQLHLTELKRKEKEEDLNAQIKERTLAIKRFQKIFEESPVGIVIIRGSEIKYVNRRFLELFGYTSESELINKRIETIQPERFIQDYTRRGKRREQGKKEVGNYRSVAVRKDGTEFPVDIHATTIKTMEGLATLGFFTDITEVQEQNKLLQQKKQETYQLQKMEAVAILAARVSHDINNMLSIVIAYAKMIDNTSDDDNIFQYTKNILNAAEKLTNMNNELLNFSKKTKDRVNPVVNDINTIIGKDRALYRRLVKVSTQIDYKLCQEPALVYIDDNHFNQIMMNLLVNAQDAISSSGKIEIQTKISGNDDTVIAKKQVYLSVKDNGCGISKDQLEHVFDPFYTTKKTGTGLGLTTVMELVKEYNGSIKVESDSEGTEFIIALPKSENY